MDWTTRGKTVLITGAARGLGAETARRVAARGANVSLVGLEPEELERVAAQCGKNAAWFECDVTDTEALQRRRGHDRALRRHRCRDGERGHRPGGMVRSTDPAAFERTIEINLLGVWRTVRAALPHVIDRQGYVLVIASLAAAVHGPGMAAYSASKAGAEAFGDSLRVEVKHLGVDVGVGYFAFIDTDMVRGADAHPSIGHFRKDAGWPFNKTYPLSQAAGPRRRDREAHPLGGRPALGRGAARAAHGGRAVARQGVRRHRGRGRCAVPQGREERGVDAASGPSGRAARPPATAPGGLLRGRRGRERGRSRPSPRPQGQVFALLALASRCSGCSSGSVGGIGSPLNSSGSSTLLAADLDRAVLVAHRVWAEVRLQALVVVWSPSAPPKVSYFPARPANPPASGGSSSSWWISSLASSIFCSCSVFLAHVSALPKEAAGHATIVIGRHGQA